MIFNSIVGLTISILASNVLASLFPASVNSCAVAESTRFKSFLARESAMMPPVAEERLQDFLTFVTYLISEKTSSWNQAKPISILNLAGGVGIENYIYSGFFGSSRFLEGAPGAITWSIEKGREQAGLARITKDELIAFDMHDYARRVEPIEGDATNPQAFSKIPDQVDILIIRHPNADEGQLQKLRGEDGWNKIFENGFNRLAPGGIAIITFYFEKETKWTEPYWKNRSDLELISIGANPFSDGLLDAYYVILSKK